MSPTELRMTWLYCAWGATVMTALAPSGSTEWLVWLGLAAFCWGWFGGRLVVEAQRAARARKQQQGIIEIMTARNQRLQNYMENTKAQDIDPHEVMRLMICDDITTEKSEPAGGDDDMPGFLKVDPPTDEKSDPA